MISFKAHISVILTLVVLAASLLPALHVFDHENGFKSSDTSTEKIVHASIDCDLCSFHLASSDTPEVYTYQIYTPLKETVYAISLAETVNLFPTRLFSLRAPPAVIS